MTLAAADLWDALTDDAVTWPEAVVIASGVALIALVLWILFSEVRRG